MNWHWDTKKGRRVPDRRSAYLGALIERLPSGVLLVGGGLALWVVGILWFIDGSYWGGGVLIFTGGALLLIWAGGGWRSFRAALSDWVGWP